MSPVSRGARIVFAMPGNARNMTKDNFPPDFTSHITVDNVNYLVHTEVANIKQKKISSKVYRDGEILLSEDEDFSGLKEGNSFPAGLNLFMEKIHKKFIEKFTHSLAKKTKKKQDYFEEARDWLRKGRGKQALKVLQEGLSSYPADPFLLSYFGCLVSLVAKKPDAGINVCKDAIKKLKESIPTGSEVFFPVFYLNLGRAYLGANNRREAIKAFNYGLKADPDDRELRGELKKLGTRSKPPVPFLKRGNPINKYIGLLVRRSA